VVPSVTLRVFGDIPAGSLLRIIVSILSWGIAKAKGYWEAIKRIPPIRKHVRETVMITFFVAPITDSFFNR
jgi:hypothetical protein